MFLCESGKEQTTNLVHDTTADCGRGHLIGCLDATAFTVANLYPIVPTAFAYGSTGRNILRGPGAQTVNFSLSKNFPIKERLRFQFRCVYNTSSQRVDHLSHSVKAAAGTAGPVHSKANADSFTSKACSTEVTSKVLAERPRARLQLFADSFEEWQASENDTGVSGRGESLNPDGSRQKFTFECLCNVRVKRVTRADLQWVR